MQEKVFEGQYSGEKILRRTHPHMFWFFLEKFSLFSQYLLLIGISILVEVFGFQKFFWSIIATIVLLVIFILHFRFLYQNTRYTFTSRRCIYFIRKSLFKRYYNEIHLMDLRHAIPKKSGIFGSIFGYGNLILVDKDEKKIIYTGITEQQQMSRYLGRIMDYIKTNGHTDDFSEYMHKKERAEHKKQA